MSSQESFPFRVLLVAAVSTVGQANQPGQAGRQEDDKYSIENQLRMGRAAVAAHLSWRAIGEIIIPGHSRNYNWLEDLYADCAEFAAIVQAIRRHECDLLICAYDDRIWRTMALQQQVLTLCTENVVQIFDCSDPQEPVPPGQFRLKAIDKLRYAIKGFAAEADNEKRREKTYPLQLARITDRRLPTLPWVPYGYRRTGTKTPPAQVPEEVHWIRWMYERRLEHAAFGMIARALNNMGIRTAHGRQWGRTSVRFVLTNEFYVGNIVWGPVSATGTHEPVFTEAEWASLQEINKLLAGDHAPRRVTHELSGLCRCAVCGGGMVYQIDRRDKVQVNIQCGTYNDYGDGKNWKIPRHRNAWQEGAIRSYLIRRLQVELGDPDAFVAMRQRELDDQQARTLEAIDTEIRQRQAQLARWNDAYEQEVINAAELKEHRARLGKTIGELEQERARAADLLAAQQNLEAQVHDLADSQAELDALLAKLPTLDWQQRRAVYLQLIRCVWLTPGEDPCIEWRHGIPL